MGIRDPGLRWARLAAAGCATCSGISCGSLLSCSPPPPSPAPPAPLWAPGDCVPPAARPSRPPTSTLPPPLRLPSPGPTAGWSGRQHPRSSTPLAAPPPSRAASRRWTVVPYQGAASGERAGPRPPFRRLPSPPGPPEGLAEAEVPPPPAARGSRPPWSSAVPREPRPPTLSGGRPVGLPPVPGGGPPARLARCTRRAPSPPR